MGGPEIWIHTDGDKECSEVRHDCREGSYGTVVEQEKGSWGRTRSKGVAPTRERELCGWT